MCPISGPSSSPQQDKTRPTGEGFGGHTTNSAESLPPEGRITKVKKTMMPPTRGTGFGQRDTDHLLGTLHVYQLNFKEQLYMVAKEHNKLFSNNLTFDSLRTKFLMLQRKKILTVDPLLPTDVRHAKNVKNDRALRYGCDGQYR